jgi:hypothetical protein
LVAAQFIGRWLYRGLWPEPQRLFASILLGAAFLAFLIFCRRRFGKPQFVRSEPAITVFQAACVVCILCAFSAFSTWLLVIRLP